MVLAVWNIRDTNKNDAVVDYARVYGKLRFCLILIMKTFVKIV